VQVSNSGGAQVRWRSDHKELFYIALDDSLMAVPVLLGDKSAQVGAPVRLFTTRVGGAIQPTFRQQYMVSKDGQRFLINTATDESLSTMTLILNRAPKQ
jgi:hypothetical protein